jgi:hypothetical protein
VPAWALARATSRLLQCQQYPFALHSPLNSVQVNSDLSSIRLLTPFLGCINDNFLAPIFFANVQGAVAADSQLQALGNSTIVEDVKCKQFNSVNPFIIMSIMLIIV